jgi:hypothetical protein
MMRSGGVTSTLRSIQSHVGACICQVGGGRYTEGIGWAIGVDRVLLAMSGTPGDGPVSSASE